MSPPTATAYLVSPRMERSLADLLHADGPLPLDLVLSTSTAIVGALDAMHTRHVLHGNITPGNLLLRPDGGIALADARIDVLDEATETGPGLHWPPEAVHGFDWTPASDVYMAGSALWTLLTGRSPYRDLPGLLAQRLPELDRQDVPADVADLLRSMLAPAPADRPSLVAGLTGGFQAALADARVGGMPGLAHLGAAGTASARASRGVAVAPPWSGRVGDSRIHGPERHGPDHAKHGQAGEGGRIIGRYRIRERIGTGGFGTVWRAEDDRGRQVAVKEIRPELLADRRQAIRFQRELDLLSELIHPHLVHALDIVTDDTTAAVVMPLYSGDLTRVLAELRPVAPPPAGWYFEVLRQLAAALAFLHGHGVVHRDVKPANLLVEQVDPIQIRLADYGIARILDLPGVTASEGQPGTLPYMAPEQINGQKDVTAAIDIYAFGVVMYELLAGHRPFEGDAGRIA
ncbi:serine/threonine-protein kinase, partial [Frankia sp. EI5c]|uniref:protein kinase domain-containing protein n=1 Tax=Frankia sp. EI5c TaxID=683316 RepID=UPI001A7E64A9